MAGNRPSRDRLLEQVHMTLIEPDGEFLPQGSNPEEEMIMFKTNAPKTALFAAAALCTVGLFAAPAAFAETKTAEVRFSDLDLGSTDGQLQLQSRVERAARNVCRIQRPTTGTMIHSGVDRDCYKQALANVHERVAAVIDNADDSRLGG
jgi:UrcA family protein